VFLDESGFLLIPPLQRTWAPRGQTPVLRHRYRRDKLSVISAITVSPKRRRLGLYYQFYDDNVTQLDMAAFLRDLLRHLRQPVILLWDQAAQHKGDPIRAVCHDHPRLQLEYLPAYAPELNPDEFVWRQAKQHLTNNCPDELDTLFDQVSTVLAMIANSPDRLQACIQHADLPFDLP
jgi:transposase